MGGGVARIPMKKQDLISAAEILRKQFQGLDRLVLRCFVGGWVLGGRDDQGKFFFQKVLNFV